MNHQYLSAGSMIWLLSCVFSYTCQSQSIDYERVEEERLVYIMNRIEYEGKKAGKNVVLRVLSVDNLPGSAERESGEVSHDIYLAISEYDELPEQSLFVMRNVLFPKVERFELDDGEPVVFISVGIEGHRQMYKVNASLGDVSIDLAH